MPLNKKGKNTPENILILCPTCHKKLDLGASEVKGEVIENVKKNYPKGSYSF